MNPALQVALDQKRARRMRLAALSYPEKVRIVERLRATALRIKAVARAAGIAPGGSAGGPKG